MKIAILDAYLGLARELADWGSLGAETTVFADTIGGSELVERLRELEAGGYDQVTIQLVHGHEESIEDWAEVFRSV